MGKGMRAGKKARAAGGFGGGGGGKNQMKQMQQIQAMQQKVEEAQAEVDAEEFETSVGGGAVKLTMNGKKEALRLELGDDVVSPDDKDMLSDLIISAINESVRKIDEYSSSKLGEVTGGWDGTL
jgi:DNA-binding YbaB/EbfC family protein